VEHTLLPSPDVDDYRNWGKYAPAITRWEWVIGRPAPAPTEPNSKGGHRLSPRFTEFMMGVPEGWICDVDISRNDKLKAAGNGVVPAQAAAALKDMLTAFEEDR
jgi:DNA (cytosine-5)-methyltransferase 1